MKRRVRSAFHARSCRCSSVPGLCYVVRGEQTTARRSAARVWPLTAGPYVPVSPSVPLSLTLALILSLSDSPGSTLCHCHSLVVSLHAGRGLSSTERRVTPGEQRQLRLQVNGNSRLVSSSLEECWSYDWLSKTKCCSPGKGHKCTTEVCAQANGIAVSGQLAFLQHLQDGNSSSADSVSGTLKWKQSRGLSLTFLPDTHRN